ncbi:MAG: hypothetical protein ACFFFC_14780 [Candidatus Thorarchaeota archaeon]
MRLLRIRKQSNVSATPTKSTLVAASETVWLVSYTRRNASGKKIAAITSPKTM